ncbi:efflux transporter outer membrane subunit [Pigmentiphaga litoralis]|uniref:efflux transporter outer membrane subunit n=1 Tax=Pigmentiphaga litoralis TaxID=516702 RepID=UPI003B4319E6
MKQPLTVAPRSIVNARVLRPSRPATLNLLAGLTLAALLAGCAVGPDYHRPTAPTGIEFKETEGWKAAQPSDDITRGAWWEIYNDPVLNRLMPQVEAANQTLAQSEAQYRQAIAVLRGTRAAELPTLSGNVSATRSGNGVSSGTTTTTTGTGVGTGVGTGTGTGTGTTIISTPSSSSSIRNQFSTSLSASWEVDLWGRIRRGVEADSASVQASAANLAAARLSAQSTLARNYFQLRVMDEQKRLLEATIKVYERSLRLNENRYDVGVSARADIVQARAQLEGARAQAIDLDWQRAQLEHAIAILTGQPPSNFAIAPAPLNTALPDVPVGLPSELLERRPDIAAAERNVQAANARIGVAKAAYFPTLTLSASGGYRNSTFADWLTAPARFWSLGPALAAPLFDGGLRRAQVSQNEAAYDAQVAAYRQTVLTALGEVEDNLVQLRVLADEQVVQQRALDAARESLRLTTNQFEAGIIDFLSLVTVQTTALNNERTNLTLLGNRLTASVALIAAIGGGWDQDLAPPVKPRPQD